MALLIDLVSGAASAAELSLESVTTAQLLGAIRRHPIWRDASDTAVRALAAHAEDRRLAPGDAVLSAGDPATKIHLLIEGAVRVFYPATEEHAEVTVKLFWAPAAFGDAESILRTRWAETVQALTPGRVIVTPASQYFRLMQVEPQVCFRQYWDVSRRFGVAIQTERAANFDELKDRVIALLIAYANHFGQPHDGGTLIDFALTQDEIVKQVSSNRRSIVQVLGQLYRGNLVTRVGRKFLVPDVSRLLAATRSGAPQLSFRTDVQPWAEIQKQPTNNR
jgi:CRP-like cAMP-binding protein